MTMKTYKELQEYFNQPGKAQLPMWKGMSYVRAHDKDCFLGLFYGEIYVEVHPDETKVIRVYNEPNRYWNAECDRMSTLTDALVRRRKNFGYRTAENVVRVEVDGYDVPLTDGLMIRGREFLNPEIAVDRFRRLNRKKAKAVRERYKPMFNLILVTAKLNAFDTDNQRYWAGYDSEFRDRMISLISAEPTAENAQLAWSHFGYVNSYTNQYQHAKPRLDTILQWLYEQDGAYNWIPRVHTKRKEVEQ